MNLTSSFNSLPTLGKVAVGAGVLGAAVGIGAVLTGCAQASPKDPNEFVRGEFGRFDADPRDGGISRSEAVMDRRGEQRTETVYKGSILGIDVYEDRVYHKEWKDSIIKAVSAASSGTNAIAGWEELKNLSSRFDVDGNGALENKEQKAFTREYGAVQTDMKKVIESTHTYYDYDGGGYNDTYPNSGGGQNGPGDDIGSGGNGSGDSYDYGGGYQGPGGNGSGDEVGSGSGSGGNGSGDEVGSGSGGYGGSNGPQNPNDEDF